MKLIRLYSILFFITVIAICFYPVFDTDFGWHMKTGAFISLTQIIPQTDIFSFSLPNHAYIYHSWLTDVILYRIYSLFGLNGVGLLYTGILSLAFTGLWLAGKKPLQTVPLFFLLIPFSLGSIGLRTQVISFLGLALVFVVTNPLRIKTRLGKASPKNWWQYLVSTQLLILPPTFLIWANMHPGFLLGLAVMAINLAQSVIHKPFKGQPKELKYLAGLIGVCGLVTFVNPATYHLHQAIITMSQNPTAAKLNTDWLPYLNNPLFSNTHRLIMAVWISLTIWANKKDRFAVVWLIVLTGLTLTSSRYIVPLMILLFLYSSAVLEKVSASLFPQKPKSLSWLLAGLVLLTAPTNYNNVKRTLAIYSDQELYAQYSLNHYPYEATQILRQKDPLNILNFFDWGGYLIWQLPQHKTFIDGRMDNFFVNGISFMHYYNQLIKLEIPNWQQTLKNLAHDLYVFQ